MRRWFPIRAVWARTNTVLALGLPVLLFLTLRYLGGIHLDGLAGLYAVLAIVGWYGLALHLVLSVACLALSPWPRVAWVVTGSLLALALFYFVVDGVFFRVYRYHIDLFYLQLVAGSLTGIGITGRMWFQMALALLACAGLVGLLFRAAGRVRHRGWLVAGMLVVLGVAFPASQVLHILAYERNDMRLTQLTPLLPFYYPVHSRQQAVQHAGVFPIIAETAPPTAGKARGGGGHGSLVYPRRPLACVPARQPNIMALMLESWRFDAMDSVFTPNIWRLGRRGSVFRNHFSSGNCTPAGVFSLFYGIHPTYWEAVKANAASIDNPVLIDILRENGYAFGIFADSHFTRHKIKDAVFRGIDVVEDFAGTTPDEKDRDLTRRLGDFVENAQREGRPFFGFAFYKSTHFSYYCPPESALFGPGEKLDVAAGAGAGHRSSVLAGYRNAVHYTDGLIGDLLGRLARAGILDSTIVVITTDHGEEMDDDGAGYWGHTSNFTGYQVRVPLVLYVPWQGPRVVDAVTSHIDLVPTLLSEGFGCTEDVRDYSNGLDLFGAIPPDRPIVAAGYVHHAVIFGDDVFVVYPMAVQKYRLWDINGKAADPQPEGARVALEEMSMFYRDLPERAGR